MIIAIENRPDLSIKKPMSIGITKEVMVFKVFDADKKSVKLLFLLKSDCKEFAPIQNTTSEKALQIAIIGTKRIMCS